MYILSKDKKILIQFGGADGFTMLNVTRNFGGKDKYAITAGGTQVMGMYPEEKNALDEITKIMEALEEGRNTYTMN
ncbi:MAG: hypothetical protein IJ644_02105 [Oscillospiraceae bacterium]|nr:hypothetical protein [Oscillospiraceae bacterium]